MSSTVLLEVERRKHIEMIVAYPMVGAIHAIIATFSLIITLYLYGTNTLIPLWYALFTAVLLTRYRLDCYFKPKLIGNMMSVFEYRLMTATRTLLGFAWAAGAIIFIRINPDSNLLPTLFVCTALAYAGTVFHVNSKLSLITYFWSIMAPVCGYMAWQMGHLIEVSVMVVSGIIYITLYTRILHKRSLKRISDTIENERLIAELYHANTIIKQAAELDALTGIKNRAYFNKQVDKLWEESQVSKGEICLILFDIDHFKPFNDNYGHLAGDDALKKVAQTLIDTPIDSDGAFYARVGGEEFVAVLPCSDLSVAVNCAEDIRTAIEQSAIQHQYSSCADVVTVSVGVAITQPTRLNCISDLFDQADQALYKAKRAGRNIVATAKPHQADAQAAPL